MDWDKSDWFSLATAIAVWFAAGIQLLYLLASWKHADTARPTVKVFNGGRDAVEFHVSDVDIDRWRITKIEVRSPWTAEIGIAEYGTTDSGALVVTGAAYSGRAVSFDPPRTSGAVVVKAAGVCELLFHMSLNANPKRTSRFVTHINIAA